MDYVSKQQFLMVVRDLVERGEVSVAELVAAGTQALDERLKKVNELRVDAEVALSMVVDLIPPSKMEKHPVAVTKAKKVLVHSGMFTGTEMSKRLAAEIGLAAEGDA